MERKELIKLASEAGFGKLLTGDGLPTMWHGSDLEMLERFAELVAAAEREACAVACDEIAADYAAVGPCAYEWMEQGAQSCAAAIRERSN